MAFGGRYIALPPIRRRITELKNRLSRARYFRGHGVHSPFVYGIVRHVFMSHELIGSDTVLLNLLQRAGVPARRALELQNLITYCGFRTFAVSGGVVEPERVERVEQDNLSKESGIAIDATAELCILLCGVSEAETLRVVREASDRGATVVLVAPYANKERERMCRAIVAAHRSTTVDNRGYLLVFNNKCLSKQHYKI